jgi:hypothetical protein
MTDRLRRTWSSAFRANQIRPRVADIVAKQSGIEIIFS